MGIVLIAALVAGCAVGLVLTAILGGVGVTLTLKSAKDRPRVWWIFALVFAISLTLCIVAVHEYPYGVVRPGSDYDVAAKNLFLQGLGYCGSPGAAALPATLAALLTPEGAGTEAK